MGSKNEFLRKRNERDQSFFDAGERIGLQKMWDYMLIALRDPEIMGKDVFGRKRMEKLYQASKDLADRYNLAFTKDKEADTRQEEMDARLREIWGDDLSTFYERYPEIKKLGYDKPQKGWVD